MTMELERVQRPRTLHDIHCDISTLGLKPVRTKCHQREQEVANLLRTLRLKHYWHSGQLAEPPQFEFQA